MNRFLLLLSPSKMNLNMYIYTKTYDVYLSQDRNGIVVCAKCFYEVWNNYMLFLASHTDESQALRSGYQKEINLSQYMQPELESWMTRPGKFNILVI
jgi:hypothetical protein